MNRARRTRRSLALCAAIAAALAATVASSSSAARPQAHAAATAAAPKGLYGALPPAGTPTKGGTITIGQLTGSTPTYIFPILPSANASIYAATFQYEMFLPLYNGPNGGVPEINYAISLAPPATFSNGDKTVTVHMKTGFRWSNGQPVDANDLLFDIDLLQQAVKESPSNFNAFTPGEFPQSVTSVKVTGKYTLVINLKRAWNPSFFLNDQLQGNVFPLPSTAWNIAAAGGPHLNWMIPANAKKIYDYLAKQGGEVASFGTNPLWKIADGPFVISSFSATNGSYVLKANPDFGGSPKPAFSELDTNTYTGITPQLNALRTGSLDIGGLDPSQLGAVPGLKASGYSVYGYPALGWFGAFFNFKDKTGHFNSIISQLYVRQALARLEDQPAYLTGIYKNAGVLAYGTVPSVPPTPYTPPDAVTAPYPFNPAAAVAELKSHGWKVVPGGQTTCTRAGSGPGECGAGIPAGTPFAFNWVDLPASQSPTDSLESESFVSEAKSAAGIDIQLQTKTFNFLVANYDDANPADAKFVNDWAVNNFGGFTDSYYPTIDSIFNTTGVYNTGAYSNPTADRLIKDSVFSSNPKAVSNEASFITQNLPVLFFPNPDYIYAVSNKVGGPSSSWLALTQEVPLPQYWYLTK